MAKNPESKAKKFVKPKTKSVAVHDADGVITGYDDAPINDPRVEIPERDLAPGRYRWNEDDGRYDPIVKARPGDETTPAALAAIAAGFVHLANNEISMPLDTLKWAMEYRGTQDGKAAIDDAADFDGGSDQ